MYSANEVGIEEVEAVDDSTLRLVSTGGLATRLGVSQSLIAKLERNGTIPKGIVIEGSGRKVWPAADVALIQARLNERRAAGRQRGGRVSAA